MAEQQESSQEYCPCPVCPQCTLVVVVKLHETSRLRFLRIQLANMNILSTEIALSLYSQPDPSSLQNLCTETEINLDIEKAE